MNDRLKDTFGRIHAEEELKDKTRGYLAQKAYGQNIYQKNVYRQRVSGLRLHRRLAAAVACLFLIMAGTGGGFLYFTPTSAISVDVNPSIELGINRFDRVVSIKGYNEDGKALASSLNLRFLDYREALDRLLTDTSLSKYVKKGQLVSVTVTGKDEEKSQKMLADVTSCTTSLDKNISCSCGHYEEMSAAHKAGMSFGKYEAFLELKKLNPDITEEEVQGLTMHQIRTMTDALLDGAEDSAIYDIPENEAAGQDSAGENSCSGHGNSNGYGQNGGYDSGYGQDSGYDSGSGPHHGHGHGHH